MGTGPLQPAKEAPMDDDARERANRFAASLSEEGRYRLLVQAVTDYAIYMIDINGIVDRKSVV